MVRVTTLYDKEINEKVFFIRGDESYAHTTDTLLELVEYSNSDDSIEGYRVGIKYNVLRDLGSSKVVLTDNDEVLGMYDWDDDDGETTIGNSTSGGFLLTYGDVHNLRMAYKGNSQCLSSKSKIIQFEKDIPSKFETQITFNNSAQINTGANLSLSVTVKINNSTSTATRSRNVLVYVDDEYHSTITTNSSSVATATISGLADGIHTIHTVVEADTNINYGEATQTVYVGYKVVIDSYPQTFVNGVDNTVKVSLKSYNGTPISSASVGLMGSTATTNSDGVASFTFNSVTSGSYKATYNSAESDAVTFYSFTPSSISLLAQTGVMGYNTSDIFSAKVTGTGTKANVSVTIDNTVIYTNNSGIITYVKVGDKNPSNAVASTMTATCGSISKTINYDVVWQYLSKPSLTINKKLGIDGTGTVMESYSGYQLNMKPQGDIRVGFYKPSYNLPVNYSIEFDVLSSYTTDLDYGTVDTSGAVLDSNIIEDFTFSKNTHITITHIGTVMTIYVDDEEIESYSVTNTSNTSVYGAYIRLMNESDTSNAVLINNIKMMRIE